jgi:hypothetical protein
VRARRGVWYGFSVGRPAKSLSGRYGVAKDEKFGKRLCGLHNRAKPSVRFLEHTEASNLGRSNRNTFTLLKLRDDRQRYKAT